jgi:hypothetical protein
MQAGAAAGGRAGPLLELRVRRAGVQLVHAGWNCGRRARRRRGFQSGSTSSAATAIVGGRWTPRPVPAQPWAGPRQLSMWRAVPPRPPGRTPPWPSPPRSPSRQAAMRCDARGRPPSWCRIRPPATLIAPPTPSHDSHIMSKWKCPTPKLCHHPQPPPPRPRRPTPTALPSWYPARSPREQMF